MIIDNKTFNQKNLNLLLNNELDYIIIKNFVDQDLCNNLCEKILNDDVKGYINAPVLGVSEWHSMKLRTKRFNREIFFICGS